MPKDEAIPTAVDDLTNRLRNTILRGEVAAGERIPIRELEERYGVSHIPIREALRRLEAEGLVQGRPRRGSVVPPLAYDELMDIYALRIAVEPAFGCRAVELGGRDWENELVQFLNDWRSSMDQSEATQLEHHRQFHLLLLRPALMTTSERVLTQLWNLSQRYIGVEFGRLPDQGVVVKAHEPLLAAALEGNGEVLATLLNHHLQHTLDVFEASLGEGDTEGIFASS